MNTFRDDFKMNGHCEDCGERVSDKTAEWSMHKFGRILCFDHQPMKVEDVVKKWERNHTTTAN